MIYESFTWFGKCVRRSTNIDFQHGSRSAILTQWYANGHYEINFTLSIKIEIKPITNSIVQDFSMEKKNKIPNITKHSI